MALQGKAILELAREKKVNNRIKRTVVERREKKNAITPWVDNVLNDGNFHFQIQPSKLLPLSQFFDGCLLTDKVNPNGDDVSGFFGMIAPDADVIAQAGNGSYSGTNAKRGSYNEIESGVITGGIRQVWDWSTSQGNGTIASVGLTRSSIGCCEIHSDSTAFESTSAYVNEMLNSGNSFDNMIGVYFFDNGGRYGYRIYYEDSSIKIQKYDINNEILIIRGGIKTPIEVGSPIVINQSLSSPNTASVSYTGSAFHVVTPSGSSLNVISISTSDWSYTTNTYTFNGISFRATDNAYYSIGLFKDEYLFVGNYIYALAVVNSELKYVKLNRTNVADVTAYDIPSTITNLFRNDNPIQVLLPNGDIYVFSFGGEYYNRAMYFHNGVCYSTYCNADNIQTHSGCRTTSVNVLKSGIILSKVMGWSSNDQRSINAIYPYISTCANLDEAVTKASDLTMKLQYEITEVAPT
ncbi:MAG: hypothetical protein IKU36_06220 [Bacteroidales bacterium]|nr:hypothetical protein [Bacteroidales bacterium]